ncbi:MAG: hypothetical protein ABGW69_01325 [Nanoarchaeota archaeon]
MIKLKRSFVLADFIYGISLMIVAIILAIFIGNLSTNFKQSLEDNTILNELSEFGTLQVLYPSSNYIINTKNFDLKLFSLKDIKVIYKVFFISNNEVNYCIQDVYYLRKGLNTIPLDLGNCINSSNGLIRFSVLYNDKLAFTYDIKYDSTSKDVELLNMPLRNYVIFGSQVYEGEPNLYLSTLANNIYLEIGSPYYALSTLLNLNNGEKKVIDVSSFLYKNLTFEISSYYNSIFSVYLNNFYIGSFSVGNKLTTKYKDDYYVKSFDVYDGENKLLHLENTKLSVDNGVYNINIKQFEICLEDAENSSIKLPGYIFVENTKKIYYTDHGDHDSCTYVPLAFTKDLTAHVIKAYSLDNKKFGKKLIIESDSSPIIIKLSED